MNTIRLNAKVVQKRLFELLDKIKNKELAKIEIELDGKVVAQLIPLT
ncbi:MAG: hypothetical protein AAB778_00310 [Patescibacteria group bacterium]